MNSDAVLQCYDNYTKYKALLVQLRVLSDLIKKKQKQIWKIRIKKQKKKKLYIFVYLLIFNDVSNLIIIFMQLLTNKNNIMKLPIWLLYNIY